MEKAVNNYSFSDRIRKIVGYYEISIYEFSKRISVAQPTVQGWLNQGREPGATQISKILTAFSDIDANWLVTGTGNMIDNSIGQIEQLKEELKAAQKELTHYKTVTELQDRIIALEGKKDHKHN